MMILMLMLVSLQHDDGLHDVGVIAFVVRCPGSSYSVHASSSVIVRIASAELLLLRVFRVYIVVTEGFRRGYFGFIEIGRVTNRSSFGGYRKSSVYLDVRFRQAHTRVQGRIVYSILLVACEVCCDDTMYLWEAKLLKLRAC